MNAKTLLITCLLSLIFGSALNAQTTYKNKLNVFRQTRMTFKGAWEYVYGYKDSNGTVAIKPAFEDAYPFSDQLAAVKKAKLWGYIGEDFGKTNTYFIKPQFSSASSFTEGLAVVSTDKGYGYISKDFNNTGYFIEPEFYLAFPFINGFALACIAEFKCGFIDTNYPESREFAIPPVYKVGTPFLKGKAIIIDENGDTHTINQKGEVTDGAVLD